jgi:hypothetical protein
MSLAGGLRDLLRPPPHRGPLIAAGGVALAVGLAVTAVRRSGLDDPDALTAALLLVPGALLLWLGAQAPNEEGLPPAYQSVLLSTGWPLVYGGLLALFTTFAVSWQLTLALASVLAGALAVWPALERNSAISLLGAAVAGGVALLTAWAWLFDTASITPLRWLALLYAAGLVLASLVLREPAPRHAEVLIDAAGLAIGFIGVASYADGAAPFWQVVLLGAGLGLAAFGALERSPGPAYLGVANLVLFIVSAGRAWSFILLAGGGVMLAAGLRPRRPLPPEPDPYRAGEAPLAARTGDEGGR